MAMPLKLRLSGKHDVAALSARYRKAGRIHIPDLFPTSVAEALYEKLQGFRDWNLMLNQDSRTFDIVPTQRAAMTGAQVAELRAIADRGAAGGFQYFYENYPIYDMVHAGLCQEPALTDLFTFLNSPGYMAFVRSITGHDDIKFADAQLTCYRRGDFLTSHNDAVEGKNRRAAFVLNMTPHWRPDWGGQLQFFGPDGHIEGGFVPSFNALNIFSIPKPHAVSQVSTFATGARYSVTGWLRAGTDPMAKK